MRVKKWKILGATITLTLPDKPMSELDREIAYMCDTQEGYSNLNLTTPKPQRNNK